MVGSKRRNHRVGLACESTGRLTEECERFGIDVHLEPSLGREVDPVRDIESVFRLAELMRRHRFDIVHTHNSKAGIVGRLAARLADVPMIIHTVHGFAFHDAESPLRRRIYRTVERAAAHWCDGLIFISRPLEAWAEREGIGRTVPHRVIYSGIDVEAFRIADGTEVRRQLRIAEDTLAVGIVSKLWEGKGHEALLVAWRHIISRWTGPHFPMLLIVGEGPLQSRLESLALELGISNNVLFLGFRTDIPAVTKALDISVLPSAFEGMGRVILEAMAAGKPVVASRVGGIPDLVLPDETGFLVKPNDADALIGPLEKLLTDDSLRHSMGSSALRALQLKHTSEGMVEEIHQFYEFIGKRRSPFY